MGKLPPKNYFIFVLILSLALFLRLGGLNNAHKHTVDEIVYFQLGLNMSHNFTDYNTQLLYQKAKSGGRILPKRYSNPLFVHPPLYPFLISIIYHFLPPYVEYAHLISILMGLLLIVVTFFIAKVLFKDNRIALLSVFLLTIDANHIITSEKIWMNTTESFFMIVSLLFFILFLDREVSLYSILTGVSIGLAMLTKFTGGLTLLVYLLYVFLFYPRRMKKINFWYMCIIPILFYLPWLCWELKVYGWGVMHQNFLYAKGLAKIQSYWEIILLILVFIIFLKILMVKIRDLNVNFSGLIYLSIIIGTIFIYFYPSKLFDRMAFLKLTYIPINGWTNMTVLGANWVFFFQRYLEISPLFIFAYLSFLFYRKDNSKLLLLLIYFLVVIGFFIAWGNFFLRYILSLDHILAILTAFCVFSIWDKLIRSNLKWLFLYRLCFVFIVTFFIMKTIFVSIFMAMPNLTCYY